MTTLEKMDYWLLRGLSGIVKLFRIRATHGTGFDKRVKKQAEIHQREINELVAQMREIPSYPTENASLAGVDHWIVQGFNGLISHLHDRLEESEPFSDHTLDLLRHEYARLTKIISLIASRSKP